MTSVSTDRLAGVNSGLSIKPPVVVATTTNITLSDTQSLALPGFKPLVPATNPLRCSS